MQTQGWIPSGAKTPRMVKHKTNECLALDSFQPKRVDFSEKTQKLIETKILQLHLSAMRRLMQKIATLQKKFVRMQAWNWMITMDLFVMLSRLILMIARPTATITMISRPKVIIGMIGRPTVTIARKKATFEFGTNLIKVVC